MGNRSKEFSMFEIDGIQYCNQLSFTIRNVGYMCMSSFFNDAYDIFKSKLEKIIRKLDGIKVAGIYRRGFVENRVYANEEFREVEHTMVHQAPAKWINEK